MANQEILGGLRLALNRGESLQKAMITFYNAGYKRGEIEEAARMIQQEKVATPIPKAEAKNSKKLELKEAKPIKKPDKEKIKSKPSKKVSAYEEKPKRKVGRWLLIAIIAFATLFTGLLIAFLLST